MPIRELNGYYFVGQHGRIEVLNTAGDRWFWVEGEVLGLIPAPENKVYALIKTQLGTGVYRVW